MLKYDRTALRTYSMLGARGAFGLALNELAAENEDILALSADLCSTSGLDRFAQNYPTRFYNTGIAEQSLIGIAAGLAAAGYTPFATTFANFAALRGCEQIRHYMGYMAENVKVVGLSAGFAMGMFGITHYGLEDIAALRSIPNLTILSPADSTETVKATLAAAAHKGPVYLRLTGGMNNPMVYKEDYTFTIGKAVTLQTGTDIALVGAGTMVAQCQKAAKLLAEKGVSCTIINMHTIKPLDTLALDSLLGHRLIVTAEEHSKIGGLGAAVAQHLAAKTAAPPLLTIGTEDDYGHAGDYAWLLQHHGLTADSIAAQITDFLGV
ncbi:MAG: transketolase C-terminal domain-containing protein [Oscillospiraceae bacterium]|nr:transketolase C-terminal domain-containing protein [Oscillospiraceae bacterium]